MKRRMLALAVSLAMSILGLVACNKDQPLATDTAASGVEGSLENDFGGYTSADEAPMFSDTEIIAESAEDEAVNEPVSAAVSSDAAAGAKAYEVRIAWGLLEGDSTATEVVDWSGRVSVSRGVLAALRVIRFESGQGDGLELPRTSRKELGFISHTKTHYDGLLLLIVDRDSTNTPGELSIQAGNYTRTFAFANLDSLNLIDPVGPEDNAVSIISRSHEVRPFAGGFLAGRWVKTEAHAGSFHGRWINSTGTNAGALRGIWGVRRNGEQVFFGKFIGLNGEFGGLLAGNWRYDRSEHAGVFAGKWYDRNRQASGTLSGHFELGETGMGRGFFQGRWFKRG